MSEDQIAREREGSKGSYSLMRPEGRSELTYSVLSPRTVIADHTEVAPGLEGQGIGLLLLERLIADARSEGFKIVPLCPFVNAQRRKHPEWADVFQV